MINCWNFWWTACIDKVIAQCHDGVIMALSYAFSLPQSLLAYSDVLFATLQNKEYDDWWIVATHRGNQQSLTASMRTGVWRHKAESWRCAYSIPAAAKWNPRQHSHSAQGKGPRMIKKKLLLLALLDPKNFVVYRKMFPSLVLTITMATSTMKRPLSALRIFKAQHNMCKTT